MYQYTPLDAQLQSCITKAIDKISRVNSTAALEDNDFENRVYASVRLVAPTVKVNEIKKDLYTKNLNHNEVPPGYNFYLGEKNPFYFARIKVPVEADSLINLLMRGSTGFSNPIFQNGSIVCEILSQVPFEGNSELLASTKKSFDDLVVGLVEKANSIKREIETFDENSLKPQIRNAIAEERNKRNRKKEAEDFLNS